MIELRRHVERIVRPIRASGHRKMRMREELLAHLTQLFEEEATAHPGDTVAALTAAAERFGDAAELRAELQATVPAIERVMCAPLPAPSNRFARRPGEGLSTYIRRTAVLATTINVVIWALFIGALAVIGPRRAHEARPGGLLWMIFAYLLLFPLLVYAPVLLCEHAARSWNAMRTAAGRAALRPALFMARSVTATMAIYAGATALFLTLFNRAITLPIVSGFWFWCIVLGAALAALPIAVLQVIQLQRWEQWEGLVLDQGSEAAGTTFSQ